MACKYETKNGRCGLKGCYAYKHTCYTPDCCKCWEPVTNFQRITASPDVLAKILVPLMPTMEGFCQSGRHWKNGACECNPNWKCEDCMVDWLQQPAPEEGERA